MADLAPPPGLDEFIAQPSVAQNAPPPGLEEFVAPELQQSKYGTSSQQAIAGVEGLAQGLAGPLATGAERLLGVKGEDITGRAEANPGTHMGTMALGLAGPALLTGGASLGAKLGITGAAEALPAIANASRFTQAGLLSSAAKGLGLEAAAGAGLGTKIVTGAAAGAFENALLTGGEEISKRFNNDPSQMAELSLASLGPSALFGGIVGGTVGGIAGIAGRKGAEAIHELPEFKSPYVSELDQAQLSAGDFRASVNASPEFSASQKEGIFSSLRDQKPNANEIRKAAAELGAPVPEGLTSDSKHVQQAEDFLLNGAPTYASVGRVKLYKEAYEKALSAVDSATAAVSPYSKAELGNVLKKTISDQIQEQYAPIQELYDTIKQYHSVIPLSERSAPAIARNIAELQELKLSPSSPEGKLASRVMDEISNLKTVDDVKAYKSILNRSISPTAPSGEKRMVSILSDKLSNLEENSIIRFAEQNMKTPEAQAKVIGIIEQRKAANEMYKSLMGNVSTLSEKLGKGRVYGPQDALNFLNERLTPEEITQKLFSKNDSEFLNFFAKEYPEQMKLMRDYQRSIIRENPAHPDQLRPPKEIIKTINKMEPEIRNHLFTPEELAKIKAVQIYTDAFPRKFNPSGTAEKSAFGQFFEHGLTGATGAVVANARDLGVLGFIKAVNKGGHPELMTAAKLAQATIKADQLATKGARAIFRPDIVLPKDSFNALDPDFAKSSFGSRAPADNDSDKKKMNKLKESIEKNIESPSQMLEAGVKDNPIPQYQTAYSAVAAQAVNYLSSLKPQTGKVSPLDSERVPSKVEEAKYNRAIALTAKPLSVLKSIRDGTLTIDDMKTISAVYPNLYRGLQAKIMDQMTEHLSKEGTIPYKTKLALSLFMGQPLDSTMQPASIRMTQGQAKEQAQPQQMPQGQKSGSMKNIGKLAPMYATPGQSREMQKVGKGI